MLLNLCPISKPARAVPVLSSIILTLRPSPRALKGAQRQDHREGRRHGCTGGLLWGEVRDLFDPDVMGALPGLQVTGASAADWHALLDLVEESGWRSRYAEDGTTAPSVPRRKRRSPALSTQGPSRGSGRPTACRPSSASARRRRSSTSTCENCRARSDWTCSATSSPRSGAAWAGRC